MQSIERPEWVPDDIPDEHINEYAESVDGVLARLAWKEKRLTGVTPGSDQVYAHIRAKRDEQLGEDHGSDS